MQLEILELPEKKDQEVLLDQLEMQDSQVLMDQLEHQDQLESEEP